MQYLQLRGLLKGRLARFSASTSLHAHIMAELNGAMEEVEEEGFIPWFLFTKDSTLALAEDEISLDLPTNFLRENLIDFEGDDDLCKMRNSTDTYWYDLGRMEKNPILGGLAPISLGQQARPTKYYVDRLEEKLYVNSWADQAYTLSLEYVRKGDRYVNAETDTTEEPLWAKYAPGYLIALAGFRLASMYLKNADAAQIFMADVTRERTKLIHKHTAVLESKLDVNSSN